MIDFGNEYTKLVKGDNTRDGHPKERMLESMLKSLCVLWDFMCLGERKWLLAKWPKS